MFYLILRFSFFIQWTMRIFNIRFWNNYLFMYNIFVSCVFSVIFFYYIFGSFCNCLSYVSLRAWLVNFWDFIWELNTFILKNNFKDLLILFCLTSLFKIFPLLIFIAHWSLIIVTNNRRRLLNLFISFLMN